MAQGVSYGVAEGLQHLQDLTSDEATQVLALCVSRRLDVLGQVSELMDELKEKVQGKDEDVVDHLPYALDWVSERNGMSNATTRIDIEARAPLKEPDEPIFDAEGIPATGRASIRGSQMSEAQRASMASQKNSSTYQKNSSIVTPASNGEDNPKLSAVSRASKASVSCDPQCILQFSTSIYYAKEGDDPEMVVDVMRLGSDQGFCSCKYSTQDGDGKAGLRYQSVSGEIEFDPGDVMKQIHVPIIESRAWSSTLEFKIVLSEAEGCILGRYLYMCRVKVIDPDCFPTNKYEELIRSNDWESIPMWGLLREYFKFNYLANPVITRRSKHQLISDQISNAYFILKLYIGKVLVDKVVGPNCKPGLKVFGIFDCPDGEDSDAAGAKTPILIVLCCLMVVPLFCVHYVEYREVFFKIGGTSRKTVQGNLVRKFLNYDESARSQLGPSDLIMSMTRDTQSLVHDGYMQIFPLIQNLGKLVLMVVLQLILGAYLAAIPVVIYPVVLISWIMYRNKLTSDLAHAQDVAQNDLVNYVTQIMTSYRLIGDYQKRPEAVVEVEKKIGTFNGKMIAADSVNLNNKYAALWLANLVTGLWYIVGGQLVLNDPENYPLGTFLLNLQVFAEVGVAWQAIFDIMLKMQSALPYLQKIVKYMNLPIDLEKRMKLNRRRRTLGEEARKTARETMRNAKKSGTNTSALFAADFVPLSLKKISYSYSPLTKPKRASQVDHMKEDLKTGDGDLEKKQKDANIKNITLDITQGTLVALVGLPGGGKSTLMRLIGGQLIPDGGDLLIPPHLRVLHISKQPVFFNDTLYNNLTYGVGKDDKQDGSVERVTGICKQLLIAEKLLKYLVAEDKDHFNIKAEWSEVLSQTQCALLSLCRAFVANPEVLVIHKPTVVFDDEHTDNSFRALREYIEKKGLCMNPKTINARRPRTCIITTSRAKGVALADKVYNVTPEGCFEKDGHNISSELLH